MTEDLNKYKQFLPSAKLVEGVSPDQLSNFKSQIINPQKEGIVKAEYFIWVENLKKYYRNAKKILGDTDEVNFMSQYIDKTLPPFGSTNQFWLDWLSITYSNVDRLKTIIDNKINDKIGTKSPYSRQQPPSYASVMSARSTSKKIKIVVAIIVVLVIIVVVFLMRKKENMYGPSDILVGRQQLVRIATTPRPIPPNYSRWY